MLKKSRINRRKSRKTNKRAKTHKRSRVAKGQDEKVKCCMCDKEIQRKDGLMPAKCLIQHGAIRAHRICQECWWSRFAKEGANHACPGCVKGLPLNGRPIDYSEVIEISD
jgi:hypothetical protein